MSTGERIQAHFGLLPPPNLTSCFGRAERAQAKQAKISRRAWTNGPTSLHDCFSAWFYHTFYQYVGLFPNWNFRPFSILELRSGMQGRMLQRRCKRHVQITCKEALSLNTVYKQMPRQRLFVHETNPLWMYTVYHINIFLCLIFYLYVHHWHLMVNPYNNVFPFEMGAIDNKLSEPSLDRFWS